MGDIVIEDAKGNARVLLGNIGTPTSPDYGIKVVAPDGATTIIDGTSDVFKIVASGTVQTASFTGPGTSTASVAVTTGIANAPGFFGWAQRNTGIGAYHLPSLTYVPATAVVQEAFQMELSTSGTTQTMLASTQTSQSATEAARTYRFYIVQEVAF